MLIPSIDLKGGAVVQLVQGERLAIRDDDVFAWVRRFERFPKVQVIDLDAAMGTGDNLALVRQIAGALSCRVGGGVRTVDRAKDILAAGARAVIVGSSLFRDGKPDLVFAQQMADAVGVDKVIAAVDSKGGQVVIHGWKTVLPITAVIVAAFALTWRHVDPAPPRHVVMATGSAVGAYDSIGQAYRVLLAREGINLFLAGGPDQVREWQKWYHDQKAIWESVK